MMKNLIMRMSALMTLVFWLGACQSTPESSTESKETKEATKTAEETSMPVKKTEKEVGSQEKPQKNSSGTSVICSWQKDLRELHHVARANGGCEVIYKKQGEDKVIAQAKRDISYCQKILNNVRGNLERAGFKCQ